MRGCDLRDRLDAEEAGGGFDQHDELDLARRQAAFGLEFLDDVGHGVHVFGAVHLGEHQRGDAWDHRGLQVAHQQAPRAVDAHQHVAAIARHLRDRIGDQRARALLLGWRDRVLEVEDDAVGAAIRPGAHEFLRGHRHEQERAPGRKIGAHGWITPVIARSVATKQSSCQ